MCIRDRVITDAVETFRAAGYVLTRDGDLRPLVLDSLSGRELSEALAAYVRRAKRGAIRCPSGSRMSQRISRPRWIGGVRNVAPRALHCL